MKQPPSSTEADSDTTDSASGSNLPRMAGALFVLTGLVHIVAPTTLLGLAKRGYSAVLDVDFDPRSEASTRVRALGVGLIAAGAHLLYYDGIWPSTE